MASMNIEPMPPGVDQRGFAGADKMRRRNELVCGDTHEEQHRVVVVDIVGDLDAFVSRYGDALGVHAEMRDHGMSNASSVRPTPSWPSTVAGGTPDCCAG